MGSFACGFFEISFTCPRIKLYETFALQIEIEQLHYIKLLTINYYQNTYVMHASFVHNQIKNFSSKYMWFVYALMFI